jgi:hypothetical protein
MCVRWRRQRVHVYPATLSLSRWHMPVTGATAESCRGVLLIECSLYPRIAIKGGVEILRRFSPLYTQQSTSVILASIRESVQLGEVQPVHIPGALNPADLFTKEMRDKEHFLQLCGAIMSDLHAPSECHDAVLQGGAGILE